MAGKRVKDLTGEQIEYNPDLVVLVDREDTGSGDWLLARKMKLGLLGNARFQGSLNGVNWHDDIKITDIYIRFTTDNSTYLDLTTDIVQEGSNLYLTDANVLAVPGVQDAVDNTHTHSNKTLLDNLVDNGGGELFLSDDGTYKAQPTPNIVAVNGNLVLSDAHEIVFVSASSADVTITLPSASTSTGKKYTIKCINDTHNCYVDPAGVDLIDSSSDTISLNLMETITIVAHNSDWWII